MTNFVEEAKNILGRTLYNDFYEFYKYIYDEYGFIGHPNDIITFCSLRDYAVGTLFLREINKDALENVVDPRYFEIIGKNEAEKDNFGFATKSRFCIISNLNSFGNDCVLAIRRGEKGYFDEYIDILENKNVFLRSIDVRVAFMSKCSFSVNVKRVNKKTKYYKLIDNDSSAEIERKINTLMNKLDLFDFINGPNCMKTGIDSELKIYPIEKEGAIALKCVEGKVVPFLFLPRLNLNFKNEFIALLKPRIFDKQIQNMLDKIGRMPNYSAFENIQMIIKALILQAYKVEKDVIYSEIGFSALISEECLKIVKFILDKYVSMCDIEEIVDLIIKNMIRDTSSTKKTNSNVIEILMSCYERQEKERNYLVTGFIPSEESISYTAAPSNESFGCLFNNRSDIYFVEKLIELYRCGAIEFAVGDSNDMFCPCFVLNKTFLEIVIKENISLLPMICETENRVYRMGLGNDRDTFFPKELNYLIKLYYDAFIDEDMVSICSKIKEKEEDILIIAKHIYSLGYSFNEFKYIGEQTVPNWNALCNKSKTAYCEIVY